MNSLLRAIRNIERRYVFRLQSLQLLFFYDRRKTRCWNILQRSICGTSVIWI